MVIFAAYGALGVLGARYVTAIRVQRFAETLGLVPQGMELPLIHLESQATREDREASELSEKYLSQVEASEPKLRTIHMAQTVCTTF